jgi:2,3-bisphosphoglycerate-dependent phosphoglycerate mutase
MSRANVDWSENRRVADHAIELTEEGKKQAEGAGKFLAQYFAQHLTTYQANSPFGPFAAQFPKIRIWNSPYRRTRQTRDHLMAACRLPSLSDLTKDTAREYFWHRQGDMHAHAVDPQDMRPLSRPNSGDSWFLDEKEHFLLHEQQFGIFDGLSDEQRREQYPAETEHYEKCKKFEGKVWAKLPMGESRMDVSRRMHQAFGTFKRDAEKHDIHNIVVVGHGTTNRAFTMAWMHHQPEWFEREPNPKNCSVRLIENGEDKGYIFKGFEHPEGFIHDHIPNPESEE